MPKKKNNRLVQLVGGMSSQNKPKMGLFKSISASIVAGEILYHWFELRHGEQYPIWCYIDLHNQFVPFPGLDELVTYVKK